MSGYQQKYVIEKSNGEPVDPEARYFVLRFDHKSKDPAVFPALILYAKERGLQDLERFFIRCQTIWLDFNRPQSKEEAWQTVQRR